MGLSFRRSIRLGGVRLNFSKSGVSASTGVKGLRYTVDPRGRYITVGGRGLYYRKRLDSPSKQHTVSHNTQPHPLNDQATDEVHQLKTADVSELVDSTSQELLQHLNDGICKTPIIYLVIAGILVALFSLQSLPAQYSSIGLTAVLVGGIVAIVKVAQIDRARRYSQLVYDLSEHAQARFAEKQEACRLLSTASRVWKFDALSQNVDSKRRAGAKTLVKRSPARVSLAHPKFIDTNVDVWSVQTPQQTLYFFPDQILVFENNRYGSLSYPLLRFEYSLSEFTEDAGGLPADSTVLGHTWQYVNKKGGPDKRFKDNPQLPVVQYGIVSLSMQPKWQMILQVSNQSIAREFYSQIARACYDPAR